MVFNSSDILFSVIPAIRKFILAQAEGLPPPKRGPFRIVLAGKLAEVAKSEKH